jgi:hypothetical protein
MATPEADILDEPIWGVRDIAEVVNKPPAQTNYLLAQGLLDGTKIGKQWTSTRRRLLAPFVSPSTPATAA